MAGLRTAADTTGVRGGPVHTAYQWDVNGSLPPLTGVISVGAPTIRDDDEGRRSPRVSGIPTKRSQHLMSAPPVGCWTATPDRFLAPSDRSLA
jgi:hypothetical protein